MTVALEQYDPPVADSERWMTRTDVAELLDVSPQTVDRHANAGRLRRYRVAGGRAVRYRIEDVRALLRPDPPRGEQS